MKYYKTYGFGLLLVLVLSLYLFNTYLCLGDCYVSTELRYTAPLLVGSFGVLVSISVLLFFSEQVLISWFKHIAWWSLLLTTYLVFSVNPYTSGILAIDRQETTILCMAVLFVITIVYAFVMNKRINGKTE